METSATFISKQITISLFFLMFVTSCSSPFGPDSLFSVKENLTLEWNNTDYNFGPQPVGSSTSYTFVISNTGSGPADDCGALNLSDATNFSLIQTTCINAKMAPGESCSAEISAHPISDGEKNLVVTRECKDGGVIKNTSNQIKVVGVPPTMVWSPLTYDFPNVLQYDISAEQTFTLSNTSSGIASQCGLAQISNPTDFTITQDTCGLLDLQANTSCTIKIRAEGNNISLNTTTLSRSCAVGGTVSTDLDMIRVTVDPVFLKWDQDLYAMGQRTVGSTTSWNYSYLVNYTSDLATSCSAPVLSDNTNFSVNYDGCGTNDLSGGNSCQFYFAVHPTTIGVKQATVTRSCFINGVAKSAVMTIETEGVAPTPSLNFNTTNYNYGDIFTGNSPSNGYITLSNSGFADATGCSVASLDNTTDFTIFSDTCGTADVVAQNYCQMVIQAVPTTLGTKTGTLTKSCTNGGTLTINLTSEVKTPSPNLYWSSSPYDYGDVDLDETISSGFYLYNSGTGSATGCSAPVLSDSTNFTITNDSCGTNDLAGGYASCNFAIVARPQSLGAHTTSVSRTCTVGGTVTLDPMTAVGVIKTDWRSEILVNNFGKVQSGTNSGLMKYFFRNTGSRDVTGCSVPTLSNASDFTIVSDNCGAGSAPKSTLCEVHVRANPVSVGGATTNLTRTCNESTAVVQLSSEGISNGTPIKIVSNSGTTCALLNDGYVRCWGFNDYGQVGSYTGDLAAGISTAIDVGAGVRHTCVLLSGGTVQCWGANFSGQLGDGTMNTGYAPVTVSGITNATKIAIGDNRSCALLSDQTIRCWGSNYWGDLGDGTNTDSNVPVQVVGITNAVHLSHKCAVLNTGEVKCWGSSYLGDGTMADSNVPVFVTGINNAVKVVSGTHSCALLNDQTVKCWGWNSYGALGAPGGGTVPVLATGITTATDVSVGNWSTCASLADQTVKCWGTNEERQIGNGTLERAYTPVTVIGLTGAVSVASGNLHHCALLSNNKVKCWGYDGNGRLGNTSVPRYDTVKIPYIINGINNATEVASGFTLTCALLSDQTTKCWGDHNGTPVVEAGVTNVSKISVGRSHVCTVHNDQTVSCRGDNTYGQLGSLGTLVNVTGISSGMYYNCALIGDNTVKCWGENAQGQLGDNTTNPRSVPLTVIGITNATKITTGSSHSCALLSDQTIKCWGNNSRGQIGDGTNTQRETAVAVTGITNAIDVTAGGDHTCAILSDNTVKCWGSNIYSELGMLWNGSYQGNTLAGSAVSGITTAQSLSLGIDYTCAHLASGQVKCWGGNSYAQLGNFTTFDTYSPKNLLTYAGTTIQKMGSGSTQYQNCIINNLNQIVCTGNNGYNQIGTFNHLVDVQGF